MGKVHKARLGWVRQADGSYRCDLLGHRYEIQRGMTLPWILSRDGVGVGNAATLALAKQLGTRTAQIDNDIEPTDQRAVDLCDLTGSVWPWVVVYIPHAKNVRGRWYVLNTRTRSAILCTDDASATEECRLLNGA